MEVPGKRAETDAVSNLAKSDDSDEEIDAREIETLCQPCQFENVKTKAHGICLECNEHMCNTCFRHHLKGKQCRHHEMVDMNKVSVSSDIRKEIEEKCGKHDNETVKFYCRTHEVVGCGDCIILEHSTCKPTYIKDVSKRFQENKEFKCLVSQLEQLEYKTKASEEKIQNNRKCCEVINEDALDEIRKFREHINKYLDKAEANIISETEQLKHENETSLDKLQQDCGQLSSKIETLKPKLYTQSHRENVLFIHAVKSKPIILDIEQEVAKLQTENEIKPYMFVPDEKLVSIVTSARKLGHFKRTESSLCIDEESSEVMKEDCKPIVRDFASYDKAQEVRPGESDIGVRVHAVRSNQDWESHHKRGSPAPPSETLAYKTEACYADEKLSHQGVYPFQNIADRAEVTEHKNKISKAPNLLEEKELEERLEIERSTSTGGTSVLNEKPAKYGLWGTQAFRQWAQHGNQCVSRSSQDNTFVSPEFQKLQLKNVRTQHMQEIVNIQSAMEINTFRNNYRQHIAPTLKTVNNFLYNTAYGLMDQEYVAKNYAREQMAIERMKRKSKQIEMEVQLLMKSRVWSSTTGFIEQNMRELEIDFAAVQPYVEETYTKRKRDLRMRMLEPAQAEEEEEDEEEEEFVQNAPNYAEFQSPKSDDEGRRSRTRSRSSSRSWSGSRGSISRSRGRSGGRSRSRYGSRSISRSRSRRRSKNWSRSRSRSAPRSRNRSRSRSRSVSGRSRSRSNSGSRSRSRSTSRSRSRSRSGSRGRSSSRSRSRSNSRSWSHSASRSDSGSETESESETEDRGSTDDEEIFGSASDSD